MRNNHIICPLCGEPVNKLVYRFHIEDERTVIEKIRQENPAWTEEDGICSRCVDYYQTRIVLQQQILPEIGPHFPVKSPDDFIILPAPLRMDADPRFTGKGVTICFIDSGYFPHADLVASRNRIKAMINIADSGKKTCDLAYPQPHSWHGTMTSVVCAGDGYMSKGLYKGVASEADLVLLKVQDDDGRITTENLVKALQWVLENHESYNIRVVNMSVYDDCSVSYKASLVDQLAEELIGKGIVIVAAVGNNENGEIRPPGNSLNVIAVGGIDDGNCIDGSATSLYHSTYGYTSDGLVKPELVANAIWIAAPILPGTKEKTEAEMLHRLLSLTDIQLQQAFEKNEVVLKEKINVDSSLYSRPVAELITNAIKLRIRDTKYFHPDYMHVDGTSFAAPLVTGVIAQLLQVEPKLTPMQIRTILFSTAKPFHDLPIERQGFGYIQPRKAVMKAMKNGVIADLLCSPCINHLRNTIEFYIQHDWASQVALAGTFNKWSSDMLLLEHGRNGIWKIEIPMLPKGRYAYKFFVDESFWIEDVRNPFREPDGMNGWNSVLEVN